MAKVIDRVRSSKPKYPWELWTDGQARRVERGKDFDPPAPVFRNVLDVHAYRNKLSVTASVKGDAVEFQFSSKRRRKRKPVS